MIHRGPSKAQYEYLLTLVGQKFNKLTVIGVSVNARGKTQFTCVCDCGTERFVEPRALRIGKTKSCGCSKGQLVRQANTTHGHAGRGRHTAEHRAWQNVINRCTNPISINWRWYGGRGITVCSHWRESFEQFLTDMGPRPDEHSINRIDNDKGYLCPRCLPPIGNCRWDTWDEQLRNKRSSKEAQSKAMSAWWAGQSDDRKKAEGRRLHTALQSSR